MSRWCERDEEARDMYSPDDGREPFRDPGPGEVACDCDEGVRHWIKDVDEGYEVCADCNGSGCVPAPKSNVHPLFDQILSAVKPKDEAA